MNNSRLVHFFSRRARRVVIAALLLATMTLVGRNPSDVRASISSSSVSGVVFQDFNSNGVRDTEIEIAKAVDSGVAGIEVRVFDSTGIEVGSTTTGVNGTYSLSISEAASTTVRVEFLIPAELSRYEPSFFSPSSTTASVEKRSGPAVQFVTIGETDVNFAVTVPGEYCQDNPTLVTCAMERGLGASNNVGAFTVPSGMPDFRYQNVTNQYVTDRANWPDNLYNANNARIGSSDDLGAIFGIGVDRNKNAFFGTYVKRHIEYGDAGNTNTIYRINIDDPLNVTSFVTLPGELPQHSSTPPAAGWNTYTGDTGVFRYVGRVGLGDVDVTSDGKTLLAVDMNEDAPKLYFIPINGSGNSVTAGTYASIPIPKPGTFGAIPCLGNWHPMGLGVRDNRILVGGVCGAEDSVIAPATNVVSTNGYPGAQNGVDPTQSTAFVLEYSGSLTGVGSFTTIWADSLGYERGCVYREGTRIPCNEATSTVGSIATADWGAWNEYPTLRDIDNGAGGFFASNPQAMLANIEILDTGGLVLGFRDRYMDQIAPFGSTYTLRYETDPPASTKGQGGMGAGEILRVCTTASGLVTESNGTCPSTDYPGSAVLDASTQREYYGDAFFGWADATGPLHSEVLGGSLVSMPGYSGVWSTAYDVVTMGTQGIYAFGQPEASLRNLIRPSGATGYGAQIGGYDFANLNSFNKTNGLADIELLCDQAPVQIGNRLWFDADGDGIQDADELPVVGATVRLYDTDGNVVATTTTSAKGEYSFSSTTSQGMIVGEGYVIKVDNPLDFAPGGVLETYVTTRSNATTSPSSDTEDGIDSDAAVPNLGVFGETAFPEIVVPPLEAGGNNHSFDFGFTRPVGVGNFTWVDADGDGVQDSDESPLAGVVVELVNADGTPVTDSTGRLVAPQTTGADGAYFFDTLLPGDYKVKFTAPDGFVSTVSGAGISSSDSDADRVTGVTPVFTVSPTATGDTTAENDSSTLAELVNMTIDAGFVPFVSVGDFVWLDADRDGVQDAGEPGLAGVTVSIANRNGTPVVDVFGNSVTSTTTDANGQYLFAYLPVGQYIVTVTPPAGYEATVSGHGGMATDSSTGSATSEVLSTAGQSDLTLDFGFVNPVASELVSDVAAPTDPKVTVVDQENWTTPGREVWLNPERLSTLPRGARWVESRTVLWDPVKRAWAMQVVTPEGVWNVIRGNVRFIPNKDFVGNVSIPFRLYDNKGRTAKAELYVTVVNQLPATGYSQSWMLLWLSCVLLFVGGVLRRRQYQ